MREDCNYFSLCAVSALIASFDASYRHDLEALFVVTSPLGAFFGS